MTVGRAACRVDFLVTTQVTSTQDQQVMGPTSSTLSSRDLPRRGAGR